MVWTAVQYFPTLSHNMLHIVMVWTAVQYFRTLSHSMLHIVMVWTALQIFPHYLIACSILWWLEQLNNIFAHYLIACSIFWWLEQLYNIFPHYLIACSIFWWLEQLYNIFPHYLIACSILWWLEQLYNIFPHYLIACSILWWLELLYNIFPHYLIIDVILEKKVIQHKMCVLRFLYKLRNFPFKTITEQIWTNMCIGLHAKCRLFLSDFNETGIFSTYFRKTLKNQILMKIRRAGTELFHADGRTDGKTDMTKLTVAFRNIANALENGIFASLKLLQIAWKYLFIAYPCNMINIFIITNTMHTIGVDKITLFKTT